MRGEKTMMTSVDELLAKEAIRDVNHLYAEYSDSAQLDKLLSLFTEDAVFDETCVGAPLITNRPQHLAYLKAAWPQNLSMFHVLSNLVITLTSDVSAKSTSAVMYEGIT